MCFIWNFWTRWCNWFKCFNEASCISWELGWWYNIHDGFLNTCAGYQNFMRVVRHVFWKISLMCYPLARFMCSWDGLYPQLSAGYCGLLPFTFQIKLLSFTFYYFNVVILLHCTQQKDEVIVLFPLFEDCNYIYLQILNSLTLLYWISLQNSWDEWQIILPYILWHCLGIW